jgi:hypothetical protein
MFLHLLASSLNSASVILRQELLPKPSDNATFTGFVPQYLEISCNSSTVPILPGATSTLVFGAPYAVNPLIAQMDAASNDADKTLVFRFIWFPLVRC